MEFVKMHGVGNDFVIVDARHKTDGAWPALAQAMCDRHFGIGSDGLILVLPSASADLRMRMFNPDGSEAEMCGNGIRCFAKYAHDNRLVERPEIAVETAAGIKRIAVHAKGAEADTFTVSMGVPCLAGPEIPVAAAISPVVDYPLVVAGSELPVTCVSMGNPHAVFFTADEPAAFPLATVGPQVEHHPFFPSRVNFEVCHVERPDRLIVRVWERGAGLTLACGTGACAVAVAARLKGLTGDHTVVALPGGELQIAWDGHGEVLMTGPAEYVCRGQWLR